VEETLFDAVGGHDAVLALARAWHRRCLDDPLANHPFSHGDLHPQHVERLAAYWSEALGGPDDYSRTMGDNAEVVRMHACNEPHPELDARAVELFVLALGDVPIPARARPALESYFRHVTAVMADYSEPGREVPAEEPLVHWSWDGPVG
jgi:hemoglobin